MHDLIRRQRAVEACVQRFVGKPYKPGVRDCVKLAGHAMHGMGRRVGLTKGVRYSSEAGALKALRTLGFKSLMEAVDKTGLPRIAPAAALPGDIIAMEADDGNAFGCALVVYAGNGRVIGFHNGMGVVVQPANYLAAWRV